MGIQVRVFFGIVLICSFTLSIQGSILYTDTDQTDNDLAYWGQSFTTPSGGPWDDITFNWLLDSNPVASGTAYLFDSAYNGTPNDLSSSSYLAASTGVVSNVYVFPDSLILQPNTEYFVYSDTSFTVGTAGSGPTGYDSQDPGTAFAELDPTTFVVSGDVAVPEPSTSCLVGAGFVAASLFRRIKSGPKDV